MNPKTELKEEIKELEQELEKATLSLLNETDTKSYFEIRQKIDLKKQKLKDGVDKRNFDLVLRLNLVANKSYGNV